MVQVYFSLFRIVVVALIFSVRLRNTCHETAILESKGKQSVLSLLIRFEYLGSLLLQRYVYHYILWIDEIHLALRVNTIEILCNIIKITIALKYVERMTNVRRI